MMKIYRTQDKQLTRVDDMNEGAWICLTNPTDDEVRRVAATLDIEPADIVAATDPRNRRVSAGGRLYGHHRGHSRQGGRCRRGHLYDYPPGHPADAGADRHGLLHDTAVIGDLPPAGSRGSRPARNAVRLPAALPRGHVYQQELRLIDRRRQAIEKNLAGELKDSDLMELHGLESSWSTLPRVCAQRYGAGPPDPL